MQFPPLQEGRPSLRDKRLSLGRRLCLLRIVLESKFHLGEHCLCSSMQDSFLVQQLSNSSRCYHSSDIGLSRYQRKRFSHKSERNGHSRAPGGMTGKMSID